MSEINNRKGPKPKNLIAALSEGILGYILYQARCGIQDAYSEYLLYDPVVRISKDKNWKLKSEFTVEEIDGRGDNRKIDFLCTSGYNSDIKVGIEIKYLKDSKSSLSVQNDSDKLLKLKNCVEYTKLYGFILIAGKHTDYNINIIERQKEKYALEQYYKVEFTNQTNTRYGVTVLKVLEEIN